MINKKEVLFYLFFLTGFFLLLEISFFIQANKIYFADFNEVSSRLTIPLTVLPSLLFFILAQVSLHIIYTGSIAVILFSFVRFFRLPAKHVLTFSILFWSLGICTILVANQFYFPNSKFALLTSILFVNPDLLKTAWIVLQGLCGLLIILTLFILVFNFIFFLQLHFKRWRRQQTPKNVRALFLLLIFLSICLSLLIVPKVFLKPSTPFVPSNKLNIIFIGIDSVRPDFLSFFGADHSTPFIDSFLKESVAFSEALTPLARTFPSWISVLTGKYPKHNHIRSNLALQKKFDYRTTLASILKQHGYETIFATDETRFSNIDQPFGFTEVITPPMGLNDFLIGTFNDFPLSNLLVNTTVGKWLFPYSFANRAAYVTYQPDSFLRLIKDKLGKRTSKPLFLAIHFCLPHFPYIWANLPFREAQYTRQYQASIIETDKQIKRLFTFLRQQGIFNQALVVLFSDHGEAFELAGDRITEKELFVSAKLPAILPAFYPPSLDKEAINQSAGHGTDVLSLTQYHTLLAFKAYGKANKYVLYPKLIRGAVTLLDIKPTVLALLDIPRTARGQSDGYSLLPILMNQQSTVPIKHIFLESDLSPASIRTVYPESRKIVLESAHFFQIDPLTTRLTLKSHFQEMVIKSKQVADIFGEWILAMYPQGNHQYSIILVNLKSGYWTDDMSSSFALFSPARLMINQLKNFYGSQLS